MDTGAMNHGVYTISFKGVAGAAPAYTFLSQPPPSKRRAAAKPPCAPPVCQLPPTPNRVARRPSLTAKVTNWALHVQPGSPAPVSPHRRLSNSSRRPSINFGLSATTLGIGHRRVPSSPFIMTPTTASHKTFDFTALGYNTIFTHMPKTPETPSPLLRAKAQKEQQLAEEKMRAKAQAKEESKEKKEKMIKKIKSLTHIRSRSKSLSKSTTDDVNALPPVPALPSPSYTTATAPSRGTVKSKGRGKSPSPRKSSAAKKKALYGGLIRAPPTLANELALMQFADGGKMEDHIKRKMTTESGAVGDVYRDGKGGVWWDRDEELEYRGLLADSDSGSPTDEKRNTKGWVKFTSSPTNEVTLERRDSATSNTTLDSDLDPAYMMQVEDAPAYRCEPMVNFDAPESPRAHAPIKPGASVLCLPSRPFRAAKHLRKPEFMTDMQAFGLVMSSLPKSPRSPLFPTHISNSPETSPRRPRKRPAPLKIAPGMTRMQKVVAVSSPGSGIPPLSARVPSLSATLAAPTAAPVDHRQLVREGKREFLMDSFQPEVSKFDDDSEYDFVDEEKRVDPMKGSGLMKRASRLDLRAIFGGASKF
ncbi:hypothetical protein EST38_g1013 [Candolleomyces aberdarensis]|uniref:Uncharacterized protein n=1 Tax=Candolleomyces aberdarensis TaxID=2316362 RepID=A0A4V1Q595_9AGAR|nr:hypothetical protein EST38_g1013 [Candolleomyces aberdarensis]